MSTTIDNIHHRNWKYVSIRTADVAIKRNIEIISCSMCHCERNAKDSVSSQVRLCLRTVERNHLVVNGALFENRHTNQSRRYLFVDIGYSLLYALAAIALLVTIAQFERFVFTSRSS